MSKYSWVSGVTKTSNLKRYLIQAHLAHQEFIERIGDVSPVHIHQLEELGSRRIKENKRAHIIPNGINGGTYKLK